MRHLLSKSILVVAVLLLCAWYLYPPKERLRLGKDLRGGVSMVYTVRIPEGSDRTTILTQVIEVLKDRVNPTGVLDITIQPQGLDRIEVVMPLPSPEVRALQVEYRERLDALSRSAQITAADIEEALRAGTAATRFAGSGDRGQEIQTAYNRSRELRTQLQQAIGEAAAPETITALEAQIAETEITEERLRGELLAMGIDQPRLIRALGLADSPQVLRDETGKEILGEDQKPKIGPGARTIELSAIKTEFPHLAESIDALVAAHDAYAAKRTTLDDPEDLKRLLRGAGVLEFHIAVRDSRPEGINPDQLRVQLSEGGPTAAESTVAGWFRINDLKQWYDTDQDRLALEADPVTFFRSRDLVAAEWQESIYLLLYTSPSKSLVHSPDQQWTMERVSRTADQMGRPAVAFSLDQNGGTQMGRLTGANVQEKMAIVLDGQVYSAPTLQSQISGSGQITGSFSQAELAYLTRVLAAGALEARLSADPISTSILGPSIGGENLRLGLQACLFSVIVVGIFMVGYYFFAGVVAIISLACTGLMIFGLMAMIDSTFTLPGLAGIALTIGMAVDCNVLIYERVREEMMNNGEDLRSALRISFRRVFNTIIDGQLTNLIVCIVLVKVATAEVKGFGVTMIIGVISTLFVALVITRLIFVVYAEVLKFRSLPMLPTVFPAVHRLLEPSIDWMGKRKIFFVSSIIFCAIGLGLVASQGADMLDTEFRGGVSLTMTTRLAKPGELADAANGRLLVSRAEIERDVQALGEASRDQPILAQLRAATVLTVGAVTADFKATTFQIKVSNPRGVADDLDIRDQVTAAVVDLLHDKLDAVPALAFSGMDDPGHASHTFALEKDRLGDNIGRRDIGDPVGAFLGGVAVVVEGIDPPITDQAGLQRIQRMRQQPDFAASTGRVTRVIGLDPVKAGDPSAGYTSVAVLVRDPEIDGRKVELDYWDQRLAGPEWKLVSEAFRQESSLDQVSSFSSAVARTLAAQAWVAIALSVIGIMAYVWFRFSSLRYSVAALTATAHDVIVALAALALSHYLANTAVGRMLLLDEFRIDLNVVAGLLTLIGYSLNDTIVIMDRIRENRGKLPLASSRVINLSLNQTMSRTVLTTSTTLMAVLILYIEGGTGIRPFAFILLIGLITGTYSSVGIAAPLVWAGENTPEPSPRLGGGQRAITTTAGSTA